jgi:sialidase-1
MTKAGTVLVFCEGRTGGDSGDIDVIMRRSTDGGMSFDDPQVIWNDGKNCCGNPTPVIDVSTGTIYLFMTWNLGTDDEKSIMNGSSKDTRRVSMTSSTDDGKTWSEPRDITQDVKKDHWRWYATGPSIGIQLKQSKYKNRLVIPCNHSDHTDKDHPYRSHVIYSDDSGKTWKIGGIQEPKTNESAVVECEDGTLIQSMRSYHGKGLRAFARSRDGGESWSQVELDTELTTPVCQASLIRQCWKDERGQGTPGVVLFSSPKGAKREQMTIWCSVDDGKTWAGEHQVWRGTAAYSQLVALSENRVGLIYEQSYEGKEAIAIEVLPLNWILK